MDLTDPKLRVQKKAMQMYNSYITMNPDEFREVTGKERSKVNPEDLANRMIQLIKESLKYSRKNEEDSL